MPLQYIRKNIKTNEIQKITVTLVDSNKTEFEPEQFLELINKTMESRKDELEKVRHLGASISNTMEEATMFMTGWLARGIVEAYKKKNDSDLDIVTVIEEVNAEDMIKEIPDKLRDIAAKIESGEIDALNFASGINLNKSTIGTDYD